MIEIKTRSNKYKIDVDNGRIFKDDRYVTNLTPVFTGNGLEDNSPIFAGIYDGATNEIITLSGKTKKVVDINQIK